MATNKKNLVRAKENLTPKKTLGKIQDLKAVVIKQMNAMNLTPYSLAQRANAAGGKVTEQAVRNFVTGPSAMRSDKLAALFAVLNIEVKAKR